MSSQGIFFCPLKSSVIGVYQKFSQFLFQEMKTTFPKITILKNSIERSGFLGRGDKIPHTPVLSEVWADISECQGERKKGKNRERIEPK